MRWIIIFILAAAMIVAGCVKAQTIAGDDVKDIQTDVTSSEKAEETAPQKTVKTDQNRIVVVETNKGTFKAVLYEKRAPLTTENFIKLAESGFYDGLTFHRYVSGFVIQGGDPNGDGTGGSDEKIKLEIDPELTHKKGALGMARSMHPDSASSQFYVCLEEQPGLDGSYAVFGQVIDGMDVVESLRKGDVMNKVTIMNG